MIDNRHSIDLPFWARPGFSTMAKGGDDGGGDDDDDQEDDDDDDGDGDEGDDPDADKSVEELRAELKSVRESLNKSSGSNKVKRDRIKKLQADVTAARTPKPKEDEGDKPDAEAIRASIEAEVNAKANLRTIKAEAKGALRGIGVPADQVASIVNMLGLDDVDVDDDGNVEGIDEAIDDLKTRFPQLFSKSRKKASVGGGLDRDGKQQSKVKTTSQLQADRLRRG